MEKKNKERLLQVRVSDDELALIKQAAGHENLTVSAWLRSLALREAKRLTAPVEKDQSTGAAR